MHSRWVRPATVAAAATLAYVIVLVALRGDPFVLVTIGAKFAPPELAEHVYSPAGYDGQFAYYFARYGADAVPFIDDPPYRAQRMLLPALGWLLSFGQPVLLVWSLLAVNLLALCAGTYWLERLLIARGASPWPALGFAMSIGMFGAVRMTTNEALAYALVLGALYLMDRDRWFAATGMFALATLSKEPALLCAAACALWLLQQRRFVHAAVLAIGAALPFALWQVVILRTIGSLGMGSRGGGATGFEYWPFRGFVRIFDVPPEFLGIAMTVAVFVGLFVLAPSLWSLVQLVRSFSGAFSLETWLLLINAALIPFTPASTFAEPLGIMRLIVGLQIAVILYAARTGQRHALRLTSFWAAATLLVIAVDLAVR